jgi:hypothetical protein
MGELKMNLGKMDILKVDENNKKGHKSVIINICNKKSRQTFMERRRTPNWEGQQLKDCCFF